MKGLGIMRAWKRQFILVLGLLVVVLLAGLGWIERTPILAWYCVRGLCESDESHRQWWIERVAGMDSDCLPGLVAALGSSDGRAADNADACLVCLADRWGPEDPRREHLLHQL